MVQNQTTTFETDHMDFSFGTDSRKPNEMRSAICYVHYEPQILFLFLGQIRGNQMKSGQFCFYFFSLGIQFATGT
jgi:hypothetical protein